MVITRLSAKIRPILEKDSTLMKVVYCNLIFLLMLATVICLNANNHVRAQNGVLPEPMVKNFSSYENKTLGVSLQYPTNWTKDESGNSVSIYNETDPLAYAIQIDRYVSSYPRIEQEVASFINYYKQNLTNFKLIDSVSSNRGNLSAYKILSTYYDVENKTDLKSLQFLTMQGDNLYRITYIAEMAAFDEWLATAQTIIDSVAINDISSSGQYSPLGPNDEFIQTIDDIGMAVNPATDIIYAFDYYSDVVDVYTMDMSASNLESRYMESMPIDNPSGISVDTYEDTLDGIIFVTNGANNTVAVINGSDNKVIGSIQVGNQPNEVAVNPIANRIYVASAGFGNASSSSNQPLPVIHVIDYMTNYVNDSHYFIHKPVDNIALDKFAKDISVNPQTNMIYVSKDSSDLLSVINGSDNKVIGSIQVDPFPVDIAVDQDADRIYTANAGYNKSSVSIIDGLTGKVLDKVSIGFPVALDIDADDNFLYVIHDAYSGISVVDTQTNILVEDAYNKRDISFYAYPQSGGKMQCYGGEEYFDSSDPYFDTSIVTFDNGTEIKCYADPNRGFLFQQWEIDGSVLPNSTEDLSLRVTDQTNIGAAFKEVIPFSLMIGFIAIAIVCVAIHLIHWRLFLYREKMIVKRYIRKIKAIGEGTAHDKQESLEQLKDMRSKILKFFQEGKISEENYNKIENLCTEYKSKIEG